MFKEFTWTLRAFIVLVVVAFPFSVSKAGESIDLLLDEIDTPIAKERIIRAYSAEPAYHPIFVNMGLLRFIEPGQETSSETLESLSQLARLKNHPDQPLQNFAIYFSKLTEKAVEERDENGEILQKNSTLQSFARMEFDFLRRVYRDNPTQIDLIAKQINEIPKRISTVNARIDSIPTREVSGFMNMLGIAYENQSSNPECPRQHLDEIANHAVHRLNLLPPNLRKIYVDLNMAPDYFANASESYPETLNEKREREMRSASNPFDSKNITFSFLEKDPDRIAGYLQDYIRRPGMPFADNLEVEIEKVKKAPKKYLIRIKKPLFGYVYVYVDFKDAEDPNNPRLHLSAYAKNAVKADVASFHSEVKLIDDIFQPGKKVLLAQGKLKWSKGLEDFATFIMAWGYPMGTPDEEIRLRAQHGIFSFLERIHRELANSIAGEDLWNFVREKL